jgi:DNA relaxase NicK
VDTLAPFEDLRAVCLEAAGMKARVTYLESEQGGESLGRTLYVGAPTSAVRVRVYEKWLESPGQYVEGTNRVEVQLRPPSRAKGPVSAWTPAETFCASQLTRRLASELGLEVAHPGTLQKSRETPDLERTLEAMGTQYGKAVDRWLSLSGGDVGTVLDHLAQSAVRPVLEAV